MLRLPVLGRGHGRGLRGDGVDHLGDLLVVEAVEVEGVADVAAQEELGRQDSLGAQGVGGGHGGQVAAAGAAVVVPVVTVPAAAAAVVLPALGGGGAAGGGGGRRGRGGQAAASAVA